MFEVFEDVMAEVMEERDMEWYELFDSEEFMVVESMIADRLGMTVDALYEDESFQAWMEEMSEDL